MEVPLDGPNRAAQGLGQGLHLGPAQATLVVGVVREGTICRDRLGGYSGVGEVLDLRYAGKFGLVWPRRLLCLVRRCALMIEFTKAAVPVSREGPPLFLCSFSDGYSRLVEDLVPPEAYDRRRPGLYIMGPGPY